MDKGLPWFSGKEEESLGVLIDSEFGWQGGRDRPTMKSTSG
jgi:hypothetical protein